ncbi:hypothetical protein HDE_13131 [Halotydeus destructor]|nr:hypothetical protein HDE_13131 [Halotydeus destructor]
MAAMFRAFVAFILVLATLDHCHARSLVAEEHPTNLTIRVTRDLPETAFLFSGKNTPTTLPLNDPKVRQLAHFIVDQYNAKSKDVYASKLTVIKAAKVVRNEFYYLTFDLVVTGCKKPARDLNFCYHQANHPVKNCRDVIVWVRDYKENKMQVTSFANCKP